LIIDTDVLIWFLRGNEKAKKAIFENIPFKISVVTYIEVVQGMRNKEELKLFNKYLKKWSVEIIQIDESISTRGMFFVEDFFLSHSMELADSLIAASVIEMGEILLTGNEKHYKHIPNIELEIFKVK
jgi:predicted nucleic acid-binding protein